MSRWQERHTSSLFGLPNAMSGPAELFASLGLIDGTPDVFVAAPPLGGGEEPDYSSPSPRTSSPHPSLVLSSAVSVDGASPVNLSANTAVIVVPPSPAAARRVQYATLDDIVAAVPATPEVHDDTNGNDGTLTLQRSGPRRRGDSLFTPPHHSGAGGTMTLQNAEESQNAEASSAAEASRADRVRAELLKRTQQQSYVNQLIATLSPAADGRTRVAAVVDLSASALRTHNYPYSQTVSVVPNDVHRADGSSWYSQQHPILHPVSQPASSSPQPKGDLFVRKGPVSRKPGLASHYSRAPSGRDAHYFTEVQLFYEALLEVELDDRSLPSGATKRLTTHLSGDEYNVRRAVLEERCGNIPMLLSKFHGYEEDLFKMLKAKYNAPAYRFMHHSL